jgi:integrase
MIAAQQFAVNDRIQFTGNARTKQEREAGFVNGAVGTLRAIEFDEQKRARLTVELDAKRTALAAGVRGDLSEAERRQKFSGHSLRAGLATAAQADERHVQKQLGHASAEMTRRYQRQRDRFRGNPLTAWYPCLNF